MVIIVSFPIFRCWVKLSRALQLTKGRRLRDQFVEMTDKFFDSMNVHNTEGVHKRKRFRMPYMTSEDVHIRVCIHHWHSSPTDILSVLVKIGWICNLGIALYRVVNSPTSFYIAWYIIPISSWLILVEWGRVPYLNKWEESVNAVPGLTKTKGNSRLLSAEIRLGLRMTCEF